MLRIVLSIMLSLFLLMEFSLFDLALRLLRLREFTSAVLRGKNWEIPLPPFGQGWFETVYLDDDLRVVKDIRGDYLVVDRASYRWKE
ncbi:putative plastid lipid-associated protein/fibrillin [Lupinus albus]|uniref:Putative plastid lipid-associated protein/fibrillin n=1 Tax=Lupinus albus TaxID=3870 RepID=A0A6A4NNJ1_LUPAL|nr:putative plastid lipid-associated protein/fibrillin [Lupinus albus]